MPPPIAAQPADDHSISDTLQSLIVAFVLAMAFRGFVLEGFIIPTGSMAPTLMGQHTLWHSRQTGYDFRVDSGGEVQRFLQTARPIIDPMFMRGEPIDKLSATDLATVPAKTPRMGDRILIVKTLYPFFEPQRWDVVVFKNPTDPLGEAQNYIKRLVGLPGEKTLFIDGDVFAGPAPAPGALADMSGYTIQRKSDREFVQRAVWQPVYHSEYVATDQQARGAAAQSPWRSDEWQIDGRRSYRCETAQPTELRWDSSRRPINDWGAYNMLGTQGAVFHVSDVRVAAGIVADQAGLATSLEIGTRRHILQFAIENGQATVRMRPSAPAGAAAGADAWTQSDSHPVDLPPPGRVLNVEFWHVDQAMSIYIHGKRVAHLEYNWSPQQRLEFVTGKSVEPLDSALNPLSEPRLYPEPTLTWRFSGSPVTLQHVWVDRDIYYQPAQLQMRYMVARPLPPGVDPGLVQAETAAFGTDPSKPAVLGPDHYLMCGDNSPASLDSRLWGNPDPLIADEIDPAPFVVNRKLLLGKAWLVYFPAPYRFADTGTPVVPDFGRLRFIR